MPCCGVTTPLPRQHQTDRPSQLGVIGGGALEQADVWDNCSHQQRCTEILAQVFCQWPTPPSCFIGVCHPQRPRWAAPPEPWLTADLSDLPPIRLIQSTRTGKAGSRQCSRRWKLQLFVNVAPVSKCQAQGHSPCSWAVSKGDTPYGGNRSMLSQTRQPTQAWQSRTPFTSLYSRLFPPWALTFI